MISLRKSRVVRSSSAINILFVATRAAFFAHMRSSLLPALLVNRPALFLPSRLFAGTCALRQQAAQLPSQFDIFLGEQIKCCIDSIEISAPAHGFELA